METPKYNPKYKHDCENCTFLGHHDHYDLYHCLQGGDRYSTVIARRSSLPEDYTSGIQSTLPVLMMAKELAHARGLPIVFIKDQVFALKDGFYCIVDGRVFGTWDTKAIAEAGMAVEQRRAAKRKETANA